MTAATTTPTRAAAAAVQPDASSGSSSSKLSSGLRTGAGRRDSSSSSSSKNLSHVPCKFYRQGACQAGAACPFSHADDATEGGAPCKYFLKGNCKFGAKCALAHILPDGRRVNSSSSSHARGRRESHNNSNNNNATNHHQNNHRHAGTATAHGHAHMMNGKTSPPRSLPMNMGDAPRRVSGASSSARSLHMATTTGASPLSGSIWTPGGGGSALSTSMYTDSAIIDDDEAVDDDDILIDEEDFVPSSLTDLLTPQERQRRDSRREQYSRPSFSDISDSPLPHHPSRLLNPIGTPDKKLHHQPEDTQFFMEDDATHQNSNVMT
ncbi:hypothetical protein TRICI_004904 [Trichomonascus ciferrii]|uniref:C3H1-type domain-containing protein n=1 Tax=Trichomonascus ciferrii TaxID=44093 RepID=A0A642UXE9_9ASCO|nr:hypothetical protein TRICI_004904 [Trichomonascus ciferrii]